MIKRLDKKSIDVIVDPTTPIEVFEQGSSLRTLRFDTAANATYDFLADDATFKAIIMEEKGWSSGEYIANS